MGETKQQEKQQENIIFRGAVLKHFDGRQNQEGSDYTTKLYFSAEFSDTVQEQMGWDDPGECLKPGKPAGLVGELLGMNLILTPGDKKLKDFEIQLGVKDVIDFQVVVLKDDEGEPAGRQLRFTVRTPQDGAAAMAEQYIRRVGRHESQLRITYLPQAKQEQLSLEETKPSDQEPIGTFLQGEALEAYEARMGESSEPALSPAALVGGTHQRGTKQQRGRRGGDPRDPEREAIADGTAPIQ